MPATKAVALITTATSKAAPSAATDGVPIPSGVKQANIILINSAGSATPTATIRLWGYNKEMQGWYPLGAGTGVTTANTQGVLNEGNPIEEIAANTLKYAEVVDHLDVWERLAAEIVSLGGTATAVSVVALWYDSMRRSA